MMNYYKSPKRQIRERLEKTHPNIDEDMLEAMVDDMYQDYLDEMEERRREREEEND